MTTEEHISLLEQAANMVQCDAPARRKLFEAVDVLRSELTRLAMLDSEKNTCVPKSE